MSEHAVTLYKGLDNPALLDPHINGSQGANRCPALPKINGPDGQPANRDVDAVLVWLDLSTNPHTRRQKRKEIERFMLWCIFERGTHLSSVKIDDVLAYYKFLMDIPEAWVGPRQPRGPDWRPFERKKIEPNQLRLDPKSTKKPKNGEPVKPTKHSLSEASLRQAKVILGDCFKWLTTVRYLDYNVFDQKVIRGQQERTKLKVERHIPMALMPWFCQWLDSHPADDKQAIRWRFAVAFLMKTGLREAELASAKMGDVRCKNYGEEGRWFITVTGKGNKTREIPIVHMETLMKYRVSMKLSAIPSPGESTPLWIPLRGQENVTPGAIYTVIKAMVRKAADDLELVAETETDPNMKAQLFANVQTLRAISPHWLRHSFASMEAANGKPLHIIQRAMGHASITTTENYVTTEFDEMYEEMAKPGKAAYTLPTG